MRPEQYRVFPKVLEFLSTNPDNVAYRSTDSVEATNVIVRAFRSMLRIRVGKDLKTILPGSGATGSGSLRCDCFIVFRLTPLRVGTV